MGLSVNLGGYDIRVGCGILNNVLSLLNRAELTLIALFGDKSFERAAAIAHLAYDAIVALSNSSDDVALSESKLSAEVANLTAEGVDCSHDRIRRSVERGGEGRDVEAVALNSLHDYRCVRVVVEHGHYAALTIAAPTATVAASAEAKAVTIECSHENEQEQDAEDAVTSPSVLTAALTKSHKVRVYTLTLQESRKHGEHVATAAHAGITKRKILVSDILK